jgi:hypothetical protein
MPSGSKSNHYDHLIGKKFNKWTVLEIGPILKKNRTCLCECECGNKKLIVCYNLKSGGSKGCKECAIKEMKIRPSANISHGQTKRHKCSSEYLAWGAMKTRCYNKKSRNYKNYGARGIIVCDRWLDSFENFFQDMGKKLSNKHSLDRIDNNKNYEPENCKWSLPQEQVDNRRISKLFEFKGNLLSIPLMAKEIKCHPTQMYRLLKRFPLEKILNNWKPGILNKYENWM